MTVKTLEFRHESASLKLKQLAGTQWLLQSLWSRERRKGHAKALMTRVMEYADKEQITLVLDVGWYGPVNLPHMTNQQLTTFYRGFGFEKAVGKHNPRIMFRLPSQKLHGP